jgi:hypothetical protein
MGTELAFAAKYMLRGTAEVRASRRALMDALNSLKSPGEEFKQQIVEQGAEVGELVVEPAKNVNLVVASFVKTDLDSAANLKIE